MDGWKDEKDFFFNLLRMVLLSANHRFDQLALTIFPPKSLAHVGEPRYGM